MVTGQGGRMKKETNYRVLEVVVYIAVLLFCIAVCMGVLYLFDRFVSSPEGPIKDFQFNPVYRLWG